jgi:hypothetical protein
MSETLFCIAEHPSDDEGHDPVQHIQEPVSLEPSIGQIGQIIREAIDVEIGQGIQEPMTDGNNTTQHGMF